jgi:hypothetical protein
VAVFTAKRLAGPAFLGTSATAVYTVPAGRTAVLKQIVLNNTGTATIAVTVHLVPNGGSTATSNQIITSLSIAGNSQVIWSADLPLVAGDSIQPFAATGSAITSTISGIEIV